MFFQSSLYRLYSDMYPHWKLAPLVSPLLDVFGNVLMTSPLQPQFQLDNTLHNKPGMQSTPTFALSMVLRKAIPPVLSWLVKAPGLSELETQHGGSCRIASYGTAPACACAKCTLAIMLSHQAVGRLLQRLRLTSANTC